MNDEDKAFEAIGERGCVGDELGHAGAGQRQAGRVC
jgi:hypothetical protein